MALRTESPNTWTSWSVSFHLHSTRHTHTHTPSTCLQSNPPGSFKSVAHCWLSARRTGRCTRHFDHHGFLGSPSCEVFIDDIFYALRSTGSRLMSTILFNWLRPMIRWIRLLLTWPFSFRCIALQLYWFVTNLPRDLSRYLQTGRLSRLVSACNELIRLGRKMFEVIEDPPATLARLIGMPLTVTRL